MFIKRTHLPRLLLLAIGLTSGAEYCFIPNKPEQRKELIQYIEKETAPSIEYSHKTIRLTPKSTKYVFRQHQLLWCEKALKKQGYSKIAAGDTLIVSLKKERGKTTVVEATCYTMDDWKYAINPEAKTVTKAKLKRINRSVCETFKKSFIHTVATHKLPKTITNEGLKALGMSINPKKDLKPGAQIQLVYSTTLLPNGTSFNPRLKYIGVKDKADVFLFSNNGSISYYDANGKLLVRDTLKMPIRGRVRMGDGFGYRKDPFTRCRKFHFGIDLCAPRGTPVYTAASGTVVYSGYQSGYGKVVEVRHTGTMRTRYAHLQQTNVRQGQIINANTILGTVGMTGRTTGPHLHYEVIKNGQQVNPKKFSILDNAALGGKLLASFQVFKTQCLSQLKV